MMTDGIDLNYETTRNTKNVVVLSICQALFNSGRTLAFIAASLVSISMLGKELTLVTAPVTMMLVGTAAGTLPSAYLMHNHGRKLGFIVGGVIGALGSALAATAVSFDNFILFNLGIFLFGMYGGAAQQYRFAAADVAPKHIKAKSVSIVIAMGVVGAFIGPETVLLTKNSFGTHAFEGTFWMLGIFCLLAAIIVIRVDIPKLNITEISDTGRPLIEIIRKNTFFVALIAALFGYAVMNLLMTTTPVTMRTDLFTDTNIARVIQWHVVGMFAPGFFTGNLIKRFGVVRIIISGSILLLLAVIIALSGNTFYHFFVTLFCVGVGWNFTFTGGTILITEVHSESERGKVQGMNDFILFTGLALSSLLAGVIFHFMGWIWVIFAATPLIITVLLSAIWLRHVRKHANSGQEIK